MMIMQVKKTIYIIATALILLIFSILIAAYRTHLIARSSWRYEQRNKLCLNLDAQAVYEFHEGFARVKVDNGHWNYIDRSGQLIYAENFDQVYDFKNGMGLVKNDSKYYFIDQAGENIFNRTFDYAEPFKDGYAVIIESGKAKLIDMNGHYASKEYDQIANGGESFLTLNDGKLKLLTNDGEKNLKGSGDFLHASDGFFYVRTVTPTQNPLNISLINLEGELIGNFADVSFGKDGFIAVRDHTLFGKSKWYFIDRDGNKLFDQEYDHASVITDSIAYVRQNDKWYFINKQGDKIIEESFDEPGNFYDGIAYVYKDGKRYFIDIYGKPFCEQKNEFN